MSAPSRRYLSVWLRRLPADRLVRRGLVPADAPLIIVEPVQAALRVYALNDAAAALGLRTGMPLADVRAMYPAIHVHDAEPAADLTLLESISDWCDRYTPLIGIDPPDGLLLDISGCAHLFGGERALGRDLIARLEAQGFHVALGLADTVGCAWAAARFGRQKLVSSDQTRASLLPLPIAALRVDEKIVTALAQAGLKRIADVVERPRAPLAARYGKEFLRRIDQAFGDEDEPINPRLPLPAFMAERRFADPIGREDDVLGTIEQLAHELSAVLEKHGDGACLLQAALFRADGKVYRIEAGSSAPLRDPKIIRRLFVERLAVVGDACDPGFGYDMVRLSAMETARLDEQQAGLGQRDDDRALLLLVDRLSARFGAHRMLRPLQRDTHIPEQASAALPAQTVLSAERQPRLLGLQDADDLAPDSHIPARPLRLFAKPETIGKVVNEVSDGAPVRFQWRRIMYDVAISEGPERIAPEWWQESSGATQARDYFRVETRDGLRAWIFRQDVKKEVKRAVAGGADERSVTWETCWFLHGLLA